jgi:hypothetical protein
MPVENARLIGLAMMACFALMACGRSAGRSIDARDVGMTKPPEAGARLDVPIDDNSVHSDTVGDAGAARADTGPGGALVGPDSGRLDTPNLGDDAGTDGDVAGEDTAPDIGALDVGRDGADDGLLVDSDDGRIDFVGAALLTITPRDGTFGTVWPTPTPPIVFTVSNVGSASSGTFTVTISGNIASIGYYKITDNSCDDALSPGEACQVAVTFVAPGGAGGPYVALLNIAAEGIPGGSFAIKLSGETP